MGVFDYLRVYDAFVPIIALVLGWLIVFAVPHKAEFKKLECAEVERRVLSLPTMWLRGALMLEYTDRSLSILTFGCSLIDQGSILGSFVRNELAHGYACPVSNATAWMMARMST